MPEVELFTSLGSATAWVIGSYVLMSGVAFLMYGADKSAAQRGGRRTPEVALHLVALAGGWPGALVAQRTFRHKTKKKPFRVAFWLTVVGNIVLVWFLLGAPGLPW